MQAAEPRRKEGAHPLQQDDAAVVGLQHHAVAINVGGGHRLFAQDMLAGFHQGDGLLGMAQVGAGDIDGIHLGAVGQRLQVGKGKRGAPLRGKFGGALRRAGVDGGKLKFGVLFGFGQKLLDDFSGADGSKTDHGGTSLEQKMGKGQKRPSRASSRSAPDIPTTATGIFSAAETCWGVVSSRKRSFSSRSMISGRMSVSSRG